MNILQGISTTQPQGILNPTGTTPQGKKVARGIWDFLKKESPAVEMLTGSEGPVSRASNLMDILGSGKDIPPHLQQEAMETLADFSNPVGGMFGAMTAFHGSPHKFLPTKKNPLGEFDLSKMGSGEGAQAYGWGQYLAEGKSTGKFYQDVLGSNDQVKISKDFDRKVSWQDEPIDEETIQEIASGMIEAERIDPGAIDDFANDISLDGRVAKGIKEGKIVADKGHLYEVDLPDKHIDKMLDWDKPLSEQPDSIKRAFGVNPQLPGKLLKLDSRFGGGYEVLMNPTKEQMSVFSKRHKHLRNLTNEQTGDTFVFDANSAIHKVIDERLLDAGYRGSYKKGKGLPSLDKSNQLIKSDHYTGQEVQGILRAKALKGGLGKYGKADSLDDADRIVSKYLNSLGIPGIKYFDGTSRSAGEGTRNFVLFDPSIAKITGRE